MTHQHSHQTGAIQSESRGVNAVRNRQSLLIVLGLTVAYLVAEVAGGYLTHSLALLADAGHTLTDVLALGMAIAAIWFARRPATAAKTYGFYRLEILAALANSVLPFAVAAYIFYEAWHRLQAPPTVHSLPMLGIALVGIVINGVSAWRLHAGAAENLNMRGAFLEVLADVLGAFGVVVAAALILFTGWKLADPLVSVVIGLFILPRAWGLLKSALDVLLEATPPNIHLDEIEEAMEAMPGVTAIHELHAWTITSGFVVMSAHVLANGERYSSDVLHDLQDLLRTRFGIDHITLQVERPDHVDDGTCCSLDPRCFLVEPLSAASAELAEHQQVVP